MTIVRSAVDIDSLGTEARQFIRFTPDERILSSFDYIINKDGLAGPVKSCVAGVKITALYNWGISYALELTKGARPIDRTDFEMIKNVFDRGDQARAALEEEPDIVQGASVSYGAGFAFSRLGILDEKAFAGSPDEAKKLKQEFLNRGLDQFGKFLAMRGGEGSARQKDFDEFYRFPWHKEIARKFLADPARKASSLQYDPDKLMPNGSERSCAGS